MRLREHRPLAWAVLAGFALLLVGCAAQPASPRKAYATLPGEPVGPQAGGSWRVLDAWDWTQTQASTETTAPIRPALARGDFGLFPAEAFRLVSAPCPDCPLTPAAMLWWFQDELVAVPAFRMQPDRAAGGGAQGGRSDDPGLPALPPLVWVAAPQLIEQARLSEDGSRLRAGGTELPLVLPPALPTNTAYLDASTLRFLSARTLRVRGALRSPGDAFVARTLWPEDSRIDAAAVRHRPLVPGETLGTLIEAQAAAADGVFPVRGLFAAPGQASSPSGRPVLAFLLSGAQGDDDGARGGHLAVATGVFGPAGEWGDWLVNNFYPLSSLSEKGIVAGPVPADNYLADVNSGQLYYRPGYMLVAVLRQPRVAVAVQEALQDAMVRFHCREFTFARARLNSTAMAMDPLRGLGWRIPTTGPTSRLLALLGAPIGALVGDGMDTARTVYHSLATEQTRLMPRMAFEVAGHDLLYLLQAAEAAPGGLTAFERMLVEDVEAVLFVRLPQFPSARRFGTWPVRSMLTYGVQQFTDPTGFETAPDAGTRELPPEFAGCRPR